MNAPLQGKVQIDDADLGGECPGATAGRGSENKMAIVAASSLNAERNPIHAKISPVTGFASEALSDWARKHLSSSCSVLSDGLACFRSVVAAGCNHTAVVTGRRHPNDLPEFRWINILLGNLKTSFSGTFHAFNSGKYGKRYLGGFCFLFNRRFKMAAMTERIANTVCVCKPCPERALRAAELYASSRNANDLASTQFHIHDRVQPLCVAGILRKINQRPISSTAKNVLCG
jgi:hypothetical protein